MIILLSPTKKQNHFEKSQEGSSPFFIEDSERIICELKKLDRDGVKKLFKVSDKIAELNYERFQNWDSNRVVSRAISTFIGEAFNNLDAATLSQGDLDYLDESLIIFSGLYGVLKPYDIIKNYRLDIGDSLKIGDSNLYSYWEEKVDSYLTQRVDNDSDGIILNLASEEYTKKINFDALDAKVVTPKFLVEKDGKLKNIAVWSKKMRGSFAREVAKRRPNTIEMLMKIEIPGFKREDNFTYIRREP